MTVNVYWWRPAESFRSLVWEARYHGAAWGRMLGGGLSNFGDACNEPVLRELLGQPVTWTSLQKAEVVGAGSVLNVVLSHGSSAYVLGSGLRAVPAITAAPRGPIIGVRGKLTAAALGLSPETAIGDPGMITVMLVARPSRRRGVIVLPHFKVLNSRAGIAALRALRSQAEIILPNTDPIAMASRIASAELLVTSSLHGLIFADALGVPAVLARFTRGKLDQPQFKYDDYQSLYHIRTDFRQVEDIVRQDDWVRYFIRHGEERAAHTSGVASELIEEMFRRTAPLRPGA